VVQNDQDLNGVERRVYFLEIMAMKTLLCDVIRVQVPAILFCLPFIHIPRWLPSLLSLSTYRTTRHGQGPVSLLMDTHTTISLNYSADKEIPSRWEKQLINDDKWPTGM